MPGREGARTGQRCDLNVFPRAWHASDGHRRNRADHAPGHRAVREHAVEQRELPEHLQMAGARVPDEEQSTDQKRECKGAVVEATRALAGEWGEPPAVLRVRGEGCA